MALTHLEALTQQGDLRATAELIEDWFNLPPHQVTVEEQQDSLQITIINTPLLGRETVVSQLIPKLQRLHPQGYTRLRICSQESQDDFPAWSVELPLDEKQGELPTANVFDTVTTTFGKAMGVTTAANRIAVGIGEAVGHTTRKTSKAVTHQAMEIGDQVGKVALNANQKIGSTFAWVEENPVTRQISKALPFNWLFVVDRVDLTKAINEVEKLQLQYPDETDSEIAHRLIVNKATLAAGTGLASSLIPGFAAALFAIDLAATMSLQAELVYQIAAVYGFDVRDENRKGEALAVLGLALGGGQAMKIGGSFATRAGLVGVLRNIPMAGAVVGLGTNAVMTYSVGYAACRFYGAKQEALSTEAALAVSETGRGEYEEQARSQQRIMDQILIHVALAEYPYQSPAQVMQELDSFFSPTATTTRLEELPPVETLLAGLQRDYALPLLVRCYTLAQHQGEMQPKTAQIIDEITQKFNIDLEDLNQSSGQALV
jgi:uncharacterized protein (DUF697 family)